MRDDQGSPLPRHREKPSGSWVQGEERFRKELEEGHAWARKVQERLVSMGHDAELVPTVWKPVDQRDQFANEQDILIHTNKRLVLIEAKSRRLSFNCSPKSYPYKTAFVDTVYGWERKRDPVAAVILVSRITTEMLVIPVSTKNHWTIKKTYDRTRGFEDSWYECPADMLKPMEAFSQWLNHFS